MTADWSMRFDRRISPELLDALGPEGWLRGLIDRRHANPTMLDIQTRRDASGRRSRVSLYAGLSSILSVDERDELYRFRSHKSYQEIGSFNPSWSRWKAPSEARREWQEVDAYIDAVLADTEVLPRYLRREGQVHPLLCAGLASDYRVVQREAVIAFPSKEARQATIDPIAESIYRAVAAAGRTDPWWPGVRDRGKLPPLGAEVDLLGIDDRGRLLIIEAKPAEELKGIAWSPAQVFLYAEMFARLLESNPQSVDVLDAMLSQRVMLGLSPAGDPFVRPVRVTPVVAIGPGSLSPVALDRLAAVSHALGSERRNPTVDPLEVWILGSSGEIERRWLPSEQAQPEEAVAVTPVGSFIATARENAASWKVQSTGLPEAARDPAPYRGVGKPHAFCLPVAFSALNLLADAREAALSRFEAAGIRWHHGIGDGPSNHLLSSQVQCANCLAPFVGDAAALAELFGQVLPIRQVLPFGASTTSSYELTDHVVFEWIGSKDYLGERGGTKGTRGANTTSADAAIRYLSNEDQVEIALIEWKYTEQYIGHELSGGSTSLDVRRARYERFWNDPASPIRIDLIPYDDLFVEPFYQLFRLQLLAWQMEAAQELEAEVVRLVYVAPALNSELAASFNRASHHILGSEGDERRPYTTWRTWAAMQRRPDRFVFMDSAALVGDDSPCSPEFKRRYGHLGAAGGHRADLPSTGRVERLRAACSMAIATLGRVSGDGGVLSQLASLKDEQLEFMDDSFIDELASRLEEVAELTRRVRADQVFTALDTITTSESQDRL